MNTAASKAFGPITLDCISGSIKTFKEQNDYRISVEYPAPISKLARLTVNWRDINGNLVNFNGAENNAFILRVKRSDVPINLDRKLGLPSPVQWLSVAEPQKLVIFGVLLLGLILIIFSKKK